MRVGSRRTSRFQSVKATSLRLDEASDVSTFAALASELLEEPAFLRMLHDNGIESEGAAATATRTLPS